MILLKCIPIQTPLSRRTSRTELSVTRVDQNLHSRQTARFWLLALAMATALAGCSLGSPMREESESSLDGRVVEIPEASRGESVVFEGHDERGEKVDSDDFADRVYVVNFWYAACGPCRVEAPLLEEVWQSHKSDGVGFIGVNTYDQPATALSFAKDYGITYPSLIDVVDGRAKLAFASVTPIQATPTTLVIDRQGRVAARIIGQLPGASILSTLVEDVLAEAQ